jgi:hypothetical protein
MDMGITKTVLAKLLAYRGLMFSGCFCIEDWIPKIIVVDDYSKVIENQNIKYIVDTEKEYIDKEGQPKIWKEKGIEQGFKDVKINLWDGAGIHSSEITQYIKDTLDIEEDPTSLLWRLPYGKGMTHEVDFKKWFSDNGKSKIKDMFGTEYDINDIDIIVTKSFYKGASYFKQYGDYRDWDMYWEKFKKYNHCVGISTWNYSFEKEPRMTKASYQILQDLELTFDDINSDNNFIDLAEYSIKWLDKVINGDKIYTYCFLGLTHDNHKPSNDYMKAILKNPEMLKEETIRNYFITLMKKNIDLMKCGKIYLDGSFRFLVTDLIMFLQYISRMEMNGVLDSEEFYSKDINGVVLGERIIERNPHISKEEHLILSGKENDDIEKYCGNLANVVMVNGKSLCLPRLNGAD